MPPTSTYAPMVNPCFICKKWFDIEDLSVLRRSIREHLRTAHSDYFTWRRKLALVYLLGFLLAGILAITPIYLVQIALPWSLLYAAFLFMIPIIRVTGYATSGIRGFNKNWAKKHADSSKL